MRSGIGSVKEPAPAYFTLDIQVVLLHISGLRMCVWSKRWIAVRGHECRQTRLRIAAGRQYEAGGSERTSIVSASRSSADQSAAAGAVERAVRA